MPPFRVSQCPVTSGPVLSMEQIGPINAVLLSHDQHADNLDHSGRACLAKAGRVFTTVAGAKRLRGGAEGLGRGSDEISCGISSPTRFGLRTTIAR